MRGMKRVWRACGAMEEWKKGEGRERESEPVEEIAEGVDEEGVEEGGR